MTPIDTHPHLLYARQVLSGRLHHARAVCVAKRIVLPVQPDTREQEHHLRTQDGTGTVCVTFRQA